MYGSGMPPLGGGLIGGGVIGGGLAATGFEALGYSLVAIALFAAGALLVRSGWMKKQHVLREGR